MHAFRFACNIHGLSDLDSFTATCRRAEELGYEAVYAADHVGIPSPFPTLVAVAAATERLRVGTLVLNAPFWSPALLARDIATTDVLTGGRLEVGIGAGHMKWEFEETGIAWEPFGTRVRRMRATIDELGGLFAADGYAQQAELRETYGVPALRPVQRRGFGGTGPPLIVGGTGERVLRHAAETADTINIAGIKQVEGQPPGTFQVASAADVDQRVRFTRECAGDRAADIEWGTLLQLVVPTEDRRAAAEGVRERLGAASTEEILDLPSVLIGTTEEMAQQLLRQRERYGFTHYAVQGFFLEAFAPVIARLRELER